MNTVEETRSRCEEIAAKTIADKINELAKTKEVVLGIPGGTSVTGIFTELLKQQIEWKKVHIFMVDERCVSLNSLESNYRQAYNLFIKQLIEDKKLPENNAHPFIYDPEQAPSSIKKYDATLEKFGRKFDVILVSSGADGHIAALFPKHNSVITENTTFFLMNNAPKLPAKRMSAPRRLLQKANYGVLVFFGDDKTQAFEKFNDPKISVTDCPAKIILTLPESTILRSTN